MKLPRRHFLHLAAGAAALPTVSHFAWAQSYPIRPVRLIVGFAAGGTTDITARLIGQWLSERLGQQFVIENRTGAATNIVTEADDRSHGRTGTGSVQPRTRVDGVHQSGQATSAGAHSPAFKLSAAQETTTLSPSTRKLWRAVSMSARIADGSVTRAPSFSKNQVGSHILPSGSSAKFVIRSSPEYPPGCSTAFRNFTTRSTSSTALSKNFVFGFDRRPTRQIR